MVQSISQQLTTVMRDPSQLIENIRLRQASNQVFCQSTYILLIMLVVNMRNIIFVLKMFNKLLFSSMNFFFIFHNVLHAWPLLYINSNNIWSDRIFGLFLMWLSYYIVCPLHVVVLLNIELQKFELFCIWHECISSFDVRVRYIKTFSSQCRFWWRMVYLWQIMLAKMELLRLSSTWLLGEHDTGVYNIHFKANNVLLCNSWIVKEVA